MSRLFQHPLRTAPLLTAVLALCAGASVYVISRVNGPFWTTWIDGSTLAALRAHAVSVPLSQQLPSFFHALALFSATLAVTADWRRGRSVALSISLIVVVAMEFVQHPVVENLCRAAHRCLGSPFQEYMTDGTFDWFDLVAIAVAAAFAFSACHPMVRSSHDHPR
ncbi:MAG: hypothetical protein AAF465_08310 [Pseudomonadota bacterium]